MATTRRITVTGAKKIREKMKFFVGPDFAKDVLTELAPVARELANEIRAAARSKGSDVVANSVFSYSDNPQSFFTGTKRARVTSLVGVNRGISQGRRGPSYFEWKAKYGPGPVPSKIRDRIIERKRAKGTLLGMSLASVYEYGSSNAAPRPFFYPTVNRMRNQIARSAAAAMNRAIEKQGVPGL